MRHHLISDRLKVSVETKGAELSSVINNQGIEFIWQANPVIWPRRAPILFPIIGKLKNNQYTYNSFSYEMNQHGFARDKEFELVFKNDSNLLFELESDKNTRHYYPFDFRLQLGYHLNGNQLTCSYFVKNPSAEKIYFSIGAHPGFNLPLEKQYKPGEYYLEFENEKFTISALKNGLISGDKTKLRIKNKKLQLSPDLFKEDALIFENNQIHQINLCSSRSKTKITMRCKDWPNFGIWSKYVPQKPDQLKFICLEPWCGIADYSNHTNELTQKKDIICLEPLGEFAKEYSLAFI